MMDPPSMNRPAVHNPLPTPPQSLHDNFGEKGQSEIKSRDTQENDQISGHQKEKDKFTPPPTSFRKRSHDDAFERDGQEEHLSPSRKEAQFGHDFELYSMPSPAPLRRDADHEHNDKDGAESTVDDGAHSPADSNTGDEVADAPRQSKSEAQRKEDVSHNAWAARHPVVTPEQHYNRDRLGYARFLAAERREIKDLIRRETERRDALKQAGAKKSSKGASTAATRQRSAKRRRVEEHEDSTTPTAPAVAQSPTVTLTLAHDGDVAPRGRSTIPKQQTGSIKTNATPVTPIKLHVRAGKPAGAKPTGIVKVKSSPKEATIKSSSKPKKTIKRSKPGGMTHHMDAIKLALNTRLEKAGKIKQKNAPELFEDAYIPLIDLDGRELVEPSREMPGKELDVHDPYYNLLHPTERLLAERVRATPSEYITQKRRYFLGLGEWWRLGHELVNPSHAQSFCNQDGNNTSYMHRVYVGWGWSDRALWSPDILESLRPLTSCEEWVRK